MPAPLNLPCTVTLADGSTIAGVRLQVRKGVATVWSDLEAIAQADAVAVRLTGPNSYRVELADGTTWSAVQSPGDCGCGSRRRRDANPGGPTTALAGS